MGKILENIKRLIIYCVIIIKEFFYYDKDKIKQKLRDKLNLKQYLFDDKYRIENNYLNFENLLLLNNKWGEYKLKENETYTQSMYKASNIYGFEFIPQKLNRGVVGYAEISCGISPWGGVTSDSYFPIKIKDITSLKSVYDVEMIIQPKKYNLVYDFWLMNSIDNKPNNIVHEIMVWEDRNIARPFGKHIKTLNTTFGKYKIYHGYMDRSKENLGTNGWFFTAFVRVDRRRSGTVDIKELLNEMSKLDLIDENQYFCGVEFGSEIYNSCGYYIVNNFEILKK